jgi:hypothetical protein
MTEAGWLAGTNPQLMLRFLRGRASDRKLRLWMVAGCRMLWNALLDERSRRAVEVAERFAEGLATEDELYNAEGIAWEAVEGLHGEAILVEHASRAAAWATCIDTDLQYKRDAAQAMGLEWDRAAEAQGIPSGTRVAHQSNLLHCVFGNPCRHVAVDPVWLSWEGGTISQLAKAVYEERSLPDGNLDTSRLAILADALEDAGCINSDILNHCRSPRLHVRGCWVVDLLLAKK